MSVPLPLNLDIYNVENQKRVRYFVPSLDTISYYLFSGFQQENYAIQYLGDHHDKIQARGHEISADPDPQLHVLNIFEKLFYAV